jgi:peptide/nickel transport system permease protein
VFVVFEVIPNGDPAVRIAGRTQTKTQVEAIRRSWGFDKPVYVQYERMMEKIVTGSAVSYYNGVNVIDRIEQGLPATLSLSIGAAVLWMGCGVALGLLGALRAGRLSDRLLTVLALVGISLPVFWVGALMAHYVGFEAGLFPNGGYVPLTQDPIQWAYHLILPWTALAIPFVGVYSRVLRANLLDTMHEDYARTARAKGLSERRVLSRHVLRSSLIPIVTLWGLDFGAVVGGGAILIEGVFSLNGVGQYAAESIGTLDVPPVMAVTLVGAVFIVLCNAVVDVVYALLDPRVRLGR